MHFVLILGIVNGSRQIWRSVLYILNPAVIMQLSVKTILNLKENHPHFVYSDVRLTGTERQRIEVKVESRLGSKGICSGCGKKCAGYDRLPQREFIHVPLWGIAVIFLYSMRRLSCPTCGVTVEAVPWSAGKSPLTISYAWFLSEWAKLLSMQEVASQFRASWHHVFSAVAMAVAWGRERMDLSGITAIGVDEIHWSKKQGFMTLVYQIDNHCKRIKSFCGAQPTQKLRWTERVGGWLRRPGLWNFQTEDWREGSAGRRHRLAHSRGGIAACRWIVGARGCRRSHFAVKPSGWECRATSAHGPLEAGAGGRSFCMGELRSRVMALAPTSPKALARSGERLCGSRDRPALRRRVLA